MTARLTKAQSERRWRARHPERHAEEQVRQKARRKAMRRLRDIYPQVYDRLFREECEARGVTPFRVPTEKKHARGRGWNDEGLPPELHADRLIANQADQEDR